MSDFEIDDFTMDQVFDSLDNIEIGNAGGSLSDLFGYSKEFEHQLYDENKDDFKIPSLLYGPETTDLEYLPVMDPNNSLNFNQNFVLAPENRVNMQEFSPGAYKVNELQVEKPKTIVPLPPPAVVQNNGGNSHFRWSSELHAGFMRAVEQLGGFERATPGHVMYLMNVNGLTVEHVQAHFQEYIQGTYFPDESMTKIAGGSAPVTPPQEAGPSNPKPANKRGKRKPKAKKDHKELLAQVEAQIERSQQAQNRYMDTLMRRADQTIGNFVKVNDTIAATNQPQYYYAAGAVFNPFAPNRF